MRRRGFLNVVANGGFVAGMAPPASAQRAAAERMSERPNGPLKIAAVKTWRLEGSSEQQAGVNRQHQVQPIHVCEEQRPEEYHDRGRDPALSSTI